MRKQRYHQWLAVFCFGAALAATGNLRAQYVWSADFNDRNIPEGMLLRGDATIASTAGVGGSGCLQLTPAMTGTAGDAILPRFWGADETPADVSIRFSVKLGGNNNGVLGDGFSFTVSDGIPGVLVGEGGIGMGPKVVFDTFDNDGTDGGLSMWWPDGRSHMGTSRPPNRISGLMPDRGDWYAVDIHTDLCRRISHVKLDGDQLLSRGARESSAPVVYQNGNLVLGSRTGDAFNSHLMDNFSVTVTPYPIFREQPLSQQVTSGCTLSFKARTNFNTLPWRGLETFLTAQSATTEWQIRHPGGNWTVVPDTTIPVLWGPEAGPELILRHVRENTGLWEGDDPAWSIDGTEVRCVLTWHQGYTVVTETAVLRLLPLPRELPGVVTLFNSFPQGAASVTFEEAGKVLRLTPAQPECSGGFVFDEFRLTPQLKPQRLTSFTGTILYRGTQASDPAADGISFNLASGLPDTIPAGAGEEGIGNGLRVSLDAFSNGPGDPTALDVFWQGQLLARLPMEAWELFPDGNWRVLYVRIEPDGTLDLALDGAAAVYNMALPGWAGLDEPKVAILGRTGSLWQQQDVMIDAMAVTGVEILSQPQPVPVLTIVQEGSRTVRLQWPSNGTEQWELQESGDLLSWQRSNTGSFVVGAFRQAVVEIAAPQRFFRLKRASAQIP